MRSPPISHGEREHFFPSCTRHTYTRTNTHVRTKQVHAVQHFLCRPPLLAVERRQVRSERARPPSAQTHVVAVGFFTGIGCLPPPWPGMAGHGCLRRLRGNHAALPGVVGEYRSEMRHLRGWVGLGSAAHGTDVDGPGCAAQPGPARTG